ncbi:autotransporter domain-containing protein [Pasteurella sp. PK-2025]|uniref:autotransporter domain-containing protein n=1 Tax=unclassified Pasteurella TaxID=2621516 RepID=UPI003C77F65E
MFQNNKTKTRFKYHKLALLTMTTLLSTSAWSALNANPVFRSQINAPLYDLHDVDEKLTYYTYLDQTPVAVLDPYRHFPIIDDENKITHIGIIDTAFAPTKLLKNSQDKWRISVGKNANPVGATIDSHGTFTASVIAKHNQNAQLFALGLGVNAQDNLLTLDSTAYGLLHDKGARIFNNSFGNTADEEVGIKPVGLNDKWAEEDSIFIWAASNDGLSNNEKLKSHASLQALYPLLNDKARNGWIAVAASDEHDRSKLADYSNKIGEKAKYWGITAQGTHDIQFETESRKKSGTSFAAPVVSAAAANVWEKYPWLTNHLVTMTLLSTADKPGKDEVNDTPDATFGWGILNQERALKGPARFDKRLLTHHDDREKDLVVVDFQHRDYQNLDKLTWRNNITGDAGLRKKGTGALYLSGNNTYQGETIVENGILGIHHALTQSKVTIEQNGSLLTKGQQHNKVVIGQDSKDQDVVDNKGSLYVYGEGLEIKGNYKGHKDSRLIIDIDKSQLNVSGKLDFGDGYIVADIANLNEIPTQESKERRIIHANTIDHYQGKHAIAESISPYINISNLSINDAKTDINIEYHRHSTDHVLRQINYVTESGLNTASNVDSVLDYLAQEKSADNSPLFVAAKGLISTQGTQLAQAIDSLSGEIHASSQHVLAKQNQMINYTLSKRLASLLFAPRQTGVWVDGLYSHGELQQAGYASAKINMQGIQLGVDHALSERTLLGVSVVHSKTDGQFNRNAGHVAIQNTGLSLYGTYDLDPFYIAGRIGANWSQSDVKRPVLGQESQVKYNSNIYNLYAEFGHKTQWDKFTLNPFVAWQQDSIRQHGFKENVAAAIVSHGKHYQLKSALAGLRAHLKLADFHFNASVSHAYQLNPQRFQFQGYYAGGTTTNQPKINIQGIKQARHTTWLSAGADYQITPKVSVQSNYHLALEKHMKANNLFTVGVRYTF